MHIGACSEEEGHADTTEGGSVGFCKMKDLDHFVMSKHDDPRPCGPTDCCLEQWLHLAQRTAVIIKCSSRKLDLYIPHLEVAEKLLESSCDLGSEKFSHFSLA